MRYSLAFMISISLGCSSLDGPSYDRDAFIPIAPDVEMVLESDGGTLSDAELVVQDGARPSDDATVVERIELADVVWPRRACGVTVEHCAPASHSVRIAGEFTCASDGECWAAGALDMEPTAETCGQAGSVLHRVELGPSEQLRPGVTYGYKLITMAPGEAERWVLDETAEYRTLQEGCLNSGLRAPDCRRGPEVDVITVTRPAPDEFVLDAQLYASANGAAVTRIEVTMDGSPIDSYSLSLEGRVRVHLTGLPTGKHRLDLTVTDVADVESESVTLPFWVEESPFEWRDGPLYLLFIDRFANGDPDNDDPIGGVDAAVEWQGGDLQGATEAVRAGYFGTLGVRTIWLSPVNAQVNAAMSARSSDTMIAPYHGYWPIRARTVEPRFGGNAALKEFVEAAHAQGIRVLLDLINNQVHADHEYVSDHPDWFRRGCVCGIDPGCGWSERPFDCLFAAYLPDIDWTHPEAQAQFIDDAVYWVDEFNVDGFRVDAVKHVEPMAVFNLRAALRRRFEQGGERIVMLGETAVSGSDRYAGMCGVEYGDGYAWIEGYTGPRALDGQFDFPTYHRLAGFLRGDGALRDVDAAIVDSEMRYSADALHVQFLGSHDTARLISRAGGDPAVGCRFENQCDGPLPTVVDDSDVYARIRIAWTLLYTVRTIPLLYYGDELALPGANDPDNRRSLIWGERIGHGLSDNISQLQQEHLEFMRRLGRLRARHPALKNGDRTTVRLDDNLLVYRRQDQDAVAWVFLNTGGDQDVTISGQEAQAAEVLMGTATILPTPDGARVRLPALSATVIGTSTP